MMKRTGIIALFAAVALSSQAKAADIVDTATSAGSFKTLVTAVQAAGLADALKGQGPFTVFAPTDEAFGKLPPGTLETLLKPENKDQLRRVLTYHVVPGKIMSGDLSGRTATPETLAGSEIEVDGTGGTVKVGNATVSQPDIAASNGVIHVIDTVLLPAS